MTTPPQTDEACTSLTQDLSRAAQYYLGGKRGLAVLAGIAIVGGLAFNWGWLVAAGIAPILIGILPCATMCAIGVCCMKKTSGKSNPVESNDNKPPEIASGQTVSTVRIPVRTDLPPGATKRRPGSAEAVSSLNPDTQPHEGRCFGQHDEHDADDETDGPDDGERQRDDAVRNA